MFENIFDFSKVRTLKQSIGFYLFYLCLIMSVTGFLKILGA